MGRRKGTQPGGWPLSWAGACHALGAVATWLLVEIAAVVFRTGGLGVEKFSGPKRSACPC